MKIIGEKMSWEDILKRGSKGLTKYVRTLVEDVMTSEKLTTLEVIEKMMQLVEAKNRAKTSSRISGKNIIPPRATLGMYLNKNYSSTMEYRNHPITNRVQQVKVYYKE